MAVKEKGSNDVTNIFHYSVKDTEASSLILNKSEKQSPTKDGRLSKGRENTYQLIYFDFSFAEKSRRSAVTNGRS